MNHEDAPIEGIREEPEGEDDIRDSFEATRQRISGDESEDLLNENNDLLQIIKNIIEDYSDRRVENIKQRSDTTSSSGKDGAAMIDLGRVTHRFSVYYNMVSGAHNLKLEVSTDKSTWLPFDEINVNSGGGEDIVQGNTNFRYIRVYPDKEFTGSDIKRVMILARGED